MTNRRHVATALAALAAAPFGLAGRRAVAAPVVRDGAALAALRDHAPGLVVAMRHASAPGTFDPPGFRLDDCGTQRNLDAAGRGQAARVGAWFRAHRLTPARVRSSRWCRCLDTARLAFGTATPWPALDSIIGERDRDGAQTAALRAELARLARAEAGVGGADRDGSSFEVWVTHQVNIVALCGHSPAAGEAVLLRHDPASGAPAIVARLEVA